MRVVANGCVVEESDAGRATSPEPEVPEGKPRLSPATSSIPSAKPPILPKSFHYVLVCLSLTSFLKVSEC